MTDKPTKLPRVARLHTIGGITSELGKLYRRVHRGDIPGEEGLRRARILGIMRDGLLAAEMEQRIAALEGKAPNGHATVLPFRRPVA